MKIDASLTNTPKFNAQVHATDLDLLYNGNVVASVPWPEMDISKGQSASPIQADILIRVTNDVTFAALVSGLLQAKFAPDGFVDLEASGSTTVTVDLAGIPIKYSGIRFNKVVRIDGKSLNLNLV